ncbi:hypothetical protein NQZ68_002618 [Dissostichus eleginoides]|nr:hypothetical protein NQZ68_002618 [Dissostichus eleginoides]
MTEALSARRDPDETSGSTGAGLTHVSFKAQIFGKVIGYGYEVPAWSQRDLLYDYERHQNKESCAVAKREFTHVGLLR